MTQPRSGESAVSPGRKPRVKWEIIASRFSGDTVLTQSLQPWRTPRLKAAVG